jgi:hypothetical protein
MFLDNNLRGWETMKSERGRRQDSNEMRLLFYARPDDRDGKRLQASVYSVIPEKDIEVFRELDDFEARLRAPLDRDSLAVLLAADRQEMERLLTLRDFLRDVHIVLAIPDLEESTLELAHRLLPRFLCKKDNDFSDLEKVLTKVSQG